MIKTFLILITLVLLFPLAGKAMGALVLWQAWIYETDNSTITVAWDPADGATGYEVKTIAKYPDQEWTVSVTEPQAVLPRPRTGLFRFAVRAFNSYGCSDWAYSDGETASVTRADGRTQTRPWGVFWRLSPVIIK